MSKICLVCVLCLTLMIMVWVAGFSQNLGIGFGTSISSPEIVSWNAKFFGYLGLGNLFGFKPALRADFELFSFLGTHIYSSDTSLVMKIDFGFLRPYLGGGIGFAFLQSSYGSITDVTFNGLLGAEFNLLGPRLPLFIQAKAKTFPGPRGIIQYDVGFLYLF